MLFRPIVALEVTWKHYVTSPLQNYAEFSVSTTGRKLRLRFTSNLQQYASKAMSHLSNSYFVLLDLNVDSFTDLNQAFFCVNPSVASREEVLEVE